MCTKEQGFLKQEIRKRVSDQYLPSVLAITADIFDFHRDYDYAEKVCRAKTLICDHECMQKKCNISIIQFYIYKDEHEMIFACPEDLPETLRLHNFSGNGIGVEDSIPYDFKMQRRVRLEADVILEYYQAKEWNDMCMYSLNNYIDVLVSIFFFCPDILCCAIRNEAKYNYNDICVNKAIAICLKIYALLRKGESKEEKMLHCLEFPYLRDTIVTLFENDLKECVTTQQIVDMSTEVKATPFDRMMQMRDMEAEGLRYISGTLEPRLWRKTLHKLGLKREERKSLEQGYAFYRGYK